MARRYRGETRRDPFIRPTPNKLVGPGYWDMSDIRRLRPAPQAKKLIEQRTVGPTGRMFNFAPTPPLGGFGMKAPSRIGLGFQSAERPEVAPTAPEAAPERGFDWNRMAYVLGGIGQAVMGPFQERWQAQLGKQAQKLSQGQAYQKAVARALSGERLDPNEFTILTPEQRSEVNLLQTENEKLKMLKLKARQDYEMKMIDKKVTREERERKIEEFDIEMDLKREKFEEEKKEAPIKRQQELDLVRERAKPYIARTKEMYKPPTGVDPEQLRMFNSVLDRIGDESKRRAELADDPEVYEVIYKELLDAAVANNEFPEGYIPYAGGWVKVLTDRERALRDLQDDVGSIGGREVEVPK